MEDVLEDILQTYFGQLNDRRWSSNFSVSKDTLLELVDLYCPKYIRTLQLVVTIYWLSNYPTWDQLATFFRRDPKTLREDTGIGIAVLYDNLNEIEWDRRLGEPVAQNGPLADVTFTVDVTICELTAFSHSTANWKNFYSKKHNTHCWKYTGIISTFGGYFVYFSPLGFPGKVHDKSMWDQEQLSSKLCHGEKGLADKGYEGVVDLLTPWKGKVLNTNQTTWNYIVEQLRVNVENAFSRLKRFGIMSAAFHGKRENFHCIAQVCAQLTNMNFEHQPLRQETPLNRMREFETRAIVAFQEIEK